MANTVSTNTKVTKNASLIKKYHTNLIYDYTEYPTKGNWSEKFDHDSYKNSIIEWFPKNKEKPVLFYVHTLRFLLILLLLLSGLFYLS